MFVLCIEGPDAVGKSTQVVLLKNALLHAGHSVLLQEVPADGHIKRIIYSMLNSGLARRYPVSFQTLHFLNRFFWQYTRLPFIKHDYDVLILGRWSMSSIVYGSIEGVSMKLLTFFNKVLLTPNVTFIIHGDQYDRKVNDTYERDHDMQRSVKDAYEKIQSNANVIKINNGEKTPNDIHNEILKIVNDRLLTMETT